MKTLLRPLKRRWIQARVRRSYGSLALYVTVSEKIVGWARGPEAIELARAAKSLPPDATVVEIGSFLGSSAVLIGGGLKLGGGGVLHCIDPFDGSGDEHSTPYYRDVSGGLNRSLREQFDHNVDAAGVGEFVNVHQGTAEAMSEGWTAPIDLLFLDGDQSPEGARSAYDAWVPFLKPGGVIAVHNSNDRTFSPSHDGHRRVVVESIVPPTFVDIRTVGTTTFATRMR